MNEANFVKRMNWIATGDSFLREVELPKASIMDIAGTDGIFLTASTAPALVANGVQFNDNVTASITFGLPQDYDQDGDRLMLKFTVVPHTATSHSTDIGITNAQNRYRAGAVLSSSTATAAAESSTLSVGLVRQVFLQMSGESYQPGDVLRRVIDVNNADSTELIVVAVSIVYGSCFAAYKTADRHRDMTSST